MAEGKTQLLITLWAAKETLYKLYGKRGVDFRQHLFIDQINESTMQARIEIGDYKRNTSLHTRALESTNLFMPWMKFTNLIKHLETRADPVLAVLIDPDKFNPVLLKWPMNSTWLAFWWVEADLKRETRRPQ